MFFIYMLVEKLLKAERTSTQSKCSPKNPETGIARKRYVR